jgi:hypothetical protein
MKSATDIAEDTLEGNEMGFPRVMHVKANLLDCIGDIRPGESEILESPRKASEIYRIIHRITNSSRQFGVEIHRCGAWFASSHPSTLKDVNHILALREKKSVAGPLNFHAKKMMKGTEILHRKFLLKSISKAPK